MRHMNRSFCVGILFVAALCFGLGAPAGATTITTTPFVGVTLHQRVETSPRPLKINVLEIDLTAPGLAFRVTPSNGADPEETTRQTTRNFMTQQGAQLAIIKSMRR